MSDNDSQREGKVIRVEPSAPVSAPPQSPPMTTDIDLTRETARQDILTTHPAALPTEPERPKPWQETRELTAADRDLSHGVRSKTMLNLCLYHPTEEDHVHEHGRMVFVKDLADHP